MKIDNEGKKGCRKWSKICLRIKTLEIIMVKDVWVNWEWRSMKRNEKVWMKMRNYQKKFKMIESNNMVLRIHENSERIRKV